MENLLSLPNATSIINGQGRVLAYTKAHNPVQFTYRPDVDVSEWITTTSYDYKRGEVVGVITEPGPLTRAIHQGRSVLIYDLDRCEDHEVFDDIEEEMIAFSDVQFAFVVSA
tara:strand:- start:289 stop:624 length:336 start_codon:yes stop_codon:yes gene_type:complete